MQVWFYALDAQPPEAILPSLLRACLARDWRAVVQTTSQAQAQALDTALWEYARDSFLPHGVVGDKYAEHQPVWITHEADIPNGAQVVFLLPDATRADVSDITRLVYLLAGPLEQVLPFAQPLWAEHTANGHEARWIARAQDKWQTQDSLPVLPSA